MMKARLGSGSEERLGNILVDGHDFSTSIIPSIMFIFLEFLVYKLYNVFFFFFFKLISAISQAHLQIVSPLFFNKFVDSTIFRGWWHRHDEYLPLLYGDNSMYFKCRWELHKEKQQKAEGETGSYLNPS